MIIVLSLEIQIQASSSNDHLADNFPMLYAREACEIGLLYW